MLETLLYFKGPDEQMGQAGQFDAKNLDKRVERPGR